MELAGVIRAFFHGLRLLLRFSGLEGLLVLF